MRIGRTILIVVALTGCSSVSTGSSVPTVAPDDARASPSSGRHRTLYSFDNASGGAPASRLLLHNGLLYGTTSAYGKGDGTIFSIDAFGKLHVIYAFTGYPDGAAPKAGLIWFNGALYGTTSDGGLYDGGTIYSVTTNGVERVVHNFGRRRDGELPLADLVAVNGVLYGTTLLGGSHGKGTVFEFGASGEHVVHSFAGAPTDGGHPTAALVPYRGALYGTTRAGGKIASGGTVYKVTPFGDESVLHSFGVIRYDGQNPAAPLFVVTGPHHVASFVGTTLYGGENGDGTVFGMSPSGSEWVLHAFAGGSDGAVPVSGVILVAGSWFGTTMFGGEHGGCMSGPSGATCGTIFKLVPGGRERVIYRFHGDPDGANPEAGLTYVGGTFYGVTAWGGRYASYGTVFSDEP